MKAGELDIEQQKVGRSVILRVRSAIDLENSPRLRELLQRLAAKKPPAMVLSLEAAGSVDTSGLATFVECAQGMRRYGGRLLVCGMGKGVTDTLSLAQVKGVLTTFDSEAEALAELDDSG